MREIGVFDSHDYDSSLSRNVREAVRAIIIKDHKIALVKSEVEGYYKFPGGGIEYGESHGDALIRETAEETGLIIRKGSEKEFGYTKEIRKSIYPPVEIFEQISYYYFAEITNKKTAVKLEDYEKQLHCHLVWEDIMKAYVINMEKSKYYESSFLSREAEVLKQLMDAGY